MSQTQERLFWHCATRLDVGVLRRPTPAVLNREMRCEGTRTATLSRSSTANVNWGGHYRHVDSLNKVQLMYAYDWHNQPRWR